MTEYLVLFVYTAGCYGNVILVHIGHTQPNGPTSNLTVMGYLKKTFTYDACKVIRFSSVD
jgi:hypothetical protein